MTLMITTGGLLRCVNTIGAAWAFAVGDYLMGTINLICFGVVTWLEFTRLEQGLTNMLKKDILLQIKELMDRHYGVHEIASKMGMDVETVRGLVEMVINLWS